MLLKLPNRIEKIGNSLDVRWLQPSASTAGGMSLIPGQGIKISYAVMWQKKKKKHRENLLRSEESLGFQGLHTELIFFTKEDVMSFVPKMCKKYKQGSLSVTR